MAISLRQRLKSVPSEMLGIRQAECEDVPLMIRFWQQEGARKQFFPEYNAEDLLSSDGLLHGLDLKDILLAYSGQELVGTMAAWDQTSFRQSLVIGYNRRLSLLRLPYNWIAPLLRYPMLPHPGSILDYFYLSLICIKENDPHVFTSLLARITKQYRSRHALFMAGLHERDPLLPILRQYRYFPYVSHLYVVCWEDGEEDFRNLDRWRIPYVELGAL